MTVLDANDIRERISAYLSATTDQTVKVTDAQPLAGGASRDSWAFTAVFADGVEKRYVLRRDLPTTMNESALTRANEFAMMRAAFNHGVRSAQVQWLCEDPAPLGQPFFIMDFVDGISIGRKVMTAPELAEARQLLPVQMAEQLALIHRLDWRAHELDFLAQPTTENPAREAVKAAYTIVDELGANVPAIEFILRWCHLNAPAAERITFIHGDFRIGNLLVDRQGLAAVIDWEFAHVGDPCEELGYLCLRDWRFGNDMLRASGLSQREPFIQAYEQFADVKVDRSAVDWWEVFGNVRWAIICLKQAQRHLSGQDPSVELASLGRRSLDMQAEALHLIKRIEAQRKTAEGSY
jgi:aminoglycoside phosphotransferase (APT) family kinase protein